MNLKERNIIDKRREKMRNPDEKIFTTFTYKELATFRQCMKEIQGLSEFEKDLLVKVEKLLEEGEKWF